MKAKRVLLYLISFQLLMILYINYKRDKQITSEKLVSDKINYLCNKTIDLELEIFWDKKYIYDITRFSKFYKYCDNDDKKQDPVFTLLETKQHNEKFTFMMNKDVLYIITGKRNNLNCSVQRFLKPPQTYIPGYFVDSRLYFDSKNKYRVTSDVPGVYEFLCTNSSSNQTVVYRDIINVLHKNLSGLVEQSKETGKIIDKIKSQLKDSQNNPLLNDGNKYSQCDSITPIKNSKFSKQNVFILFIDSVSIHNLKRSFPVTYKYLKEQLKNNVLFENMNTLGEGTFTNLQASMAGIMHEPNDQLGIDDSEYEYFIKLNSTFNDFYPFIWRDFEKHMNYLTVFSEDHEDIGVFTYRRKGFSLNPTAMFDYSFWYKYNRVYHPTFCKNTIPTYMTMLDIVKQKMTRMNSFGNEKLPYFYLTHWIYYTHTFKIFPKKFDIETKNMLEDFEKKGWFDNTLLIVMSDHGFKFGHDSTLQRLEQDWPFMSIRLPKSYWNTEFQTNLVNNRNKLITHFDLFKTLKEFFYINKLGGVQTVLKNKKCRELFKKNNHKVRALRGISFMENIPMNRSCVDAMISNTFCLCNKKINISIEQFLDESKLKLDRLIKFVSGHLNQKVAYFRNMCEEYIFSRIVSVNKVLGLFIYYEFFVLYQPGDSVYQINLAYENSTFRIVDRMIRISRYNKQSYCMTDKAKMGFCYCYKSSPINQKAFLNEFHLNETQLEQIVKSHINSKTDKLRDKCSLFQLEKIASITKISTAKNHFYRSKALFKPGKTEFMLDLYKNKTTNQVIIKQEKRLNKLKYGKFCIEDKNLIDFCNCK